jgi:hypothetical protein
MNREDETRKALRKDVTPGYEMRPLGEYKVTRKPAKSEFGELQRGFLWGAVRMQYPNIKWIGIVGPKQE